MEYYKILDLADIVYFCELDHIEKIELWEFVQNYDNKYMVSDLGRIKSFKYKEPRIMKQAKNSHGYLGVSLSRKNLIKTTLIHALVAESFLGHIIGCGLVVNHKNFIRIDNIKSNLEIVTIRENANQKHLKSTSIYTGVSYDKTCDKWVSSIHINGKQKTLGRFKTELEAHNCYQQKLKEHESTKTNL